MQICERWLATGCISAINAALGSLPTASLTLLDATELFLSSAQLRQSLAFAPMLDAAGDILLTEYGNVVMVLGSPALTLQALQLPQPALLYLLNSDKLVTDHEDSVLVLACWWLEGPVGKWCSTEEVEELKGAIRYSRLSSTYLVQVLHQLPRLRPTEVHLLELLGFQAVDKVHAAQYFQSAKPGSVPAGWLKPARASPENSDSSITVDMDIPKALLEEHLDALRKDTANGDGTQHALEPSQVTRTRFTVALWFTSVIGLGKFAVGINLSAPLPTSGDRMILPRGALCNLCYSVQGNHCVYKSGHVQQASLQRYCGDGNFGTSNFPQRVSKLPGDPMDPSWWEPLLIDGAVRLSAVVTPL